MYPQIFQKVFSQPWLVLPQTHKAIQQTLLERVQGNEPILPKADDRYPHEVMTEFGAMAIEYYSTFRNDIAYVKLYGVIGKHLSSLEMMCGGCSLDHALQGLLDAEKDSKIKYIVLDISSPGGVVTGVAEFGKMIQRISQTKPVFAYTENMMCSAAMWIGSCCQRVISTPSAIIGSIGVYMAWFDETKKNEKEGRDLMLFEAGNHKAIGLRPPTAEEKEMLQNEVEQLHEDFKNVIRENRPDVEDSTMEGLTYKGSEAVELGLVDDLVYCFDDCLDLISG